MGTRYRYFTHNNGPPNDGTPPGLEPPEGAMFTAFGPWCPQSTSPFGPPPPFGSPPPFGPPAGFPSYCGTPPAGHGPMMCFPNSVAPPGPSFFPVPAAAPPPPYTPSPWGQPVPQMRANEQPPPGARMNGELPKFKSKQGHLFSKKLTTFHLVLDGTKPWAWGAGQHRMQIYTAPSSMPIDEFIELIGASERAPRGTPRERIGVQEAIDTGDGHWRAGMAVCLEDEEITYQQADGTRAFMTLEQLGWSSQRGEAGRGKPVTITLLP